MTKTSAAQVLADNTILAENTFGITREAAFELAVAVMIAEDPETMKTFLSAAMAQFEKEAANA